MYCLATKKEYPSSEDCLYLNLWVPKKFRKINEVYSNNSASVMIWIYGGGYTSGTSSLDLYNGLTLAAVNDVIVASLNYRLGAFGFLYLGIDEAPGNMGLYDQAMAMQWIKDNIQFFGGNPNSITIFGESAGSGSISAHLLSPVTSHLVKRVILQSGVVNSPWSYTSAEKSKALALNLAKRIGCNDTTTNSTVIESGPNDAIKCIKNNFQKLYSIGLDLPYTPTVNYVLIL